MKFDIAERSRRRRFYNVLSTYNKYHQQNSNHSHEMKKSIFLIHERNCRSFFNSCASFEKNNNRASFKMFFILKRLNIRQR